MTRSLRFQRSGAAFMECCQTCKNSAAIQNTLTFVHVNRNDFRVLCLCSVVGCRRPPVPVHGSTEGVFHHSGARVTFRCDPGFQLRGFRSAVCLSDGTWSAPAPECGEITVVVRLSRIWLILHPHAVNSLPIQFQWNKCVFCRQSRPTGTTSWSMGPTMS